MPPTTTTSYVDEVWQYRAWQCVICSIDKRVWQQLQHIPSPAPPVQQLASTTPLATVPAGPQALQAQIGTNPAEPQLPGPGLGGKPCQGGNRVCAMLTTKSQCKKQTWGGNQDEYICASLPWCGWCFPTTVYTSLLHVWHSKSNHHKHLWLHSILERLNGWQILSNAESCEGQLTATYGSSCVPFGFCHWCQAAPKSSSL